MAVQQAQKDLSRWFAQRTTEVYFAAPLPLRDTAPRPPSPRPEVRRSARKPKAGKQEVICGYTASHCPCFCSAATCESTGACKHGRDPCRTGSVAAKENGTSWSHPTSNGEDRVARALILPTTSDGSQPASHLTCLAVLLPRLPVVRRHYFIMFCFMCGL